MRLTTRLLAVAALAATVCATCATCARAGGIVRVDPPVWNYGVRPRAHVITRRVRLRADDGSEIHLGVVQVACDCIKARVVTQSGSGDDPVTIDVEMYTEDFGGATKHSVFFMMERPADALVRLDVVGWVRAGTGDPRIEAFYAPDEPAGQRFLSWWRTAKAAYPDMPRVELKPIDDIEKNYTRLRDLETATKVSGPAADVSVFVDERIALRGMVNVERGLYGLMNVRGDMRPGVLARSPSPDAGPAAPREPSPAREAAVERGERAPDGAGESVVQVRLYHFSDCRVCRAVIDEARRVAQQHGRRVDLSIVDCEKDRDEVPRLYAILKKYRDVPQVRPSIIALVGDEAALGEERVMVELGDLVDRQLARGGAALSIPSPDAEPGADEIAGGVALVPVVLAALADGVNPCAFAAIVLLISILSTAGPADASHGPNARGLLLGGGSFIAGVFVTYYAAGMAALTAIGGLGAFPVARAVLFWVVWALAVAGAVFSAVDAWTYYRTGDPQRLKLKVPGALRSLFVPVLKGRFRRLGLIVGGFASGLIIAVLEGVCTGQMYLPTIQYMASTPGLRIRGAAYLFLYNVLFVLPLVAILGAAVAGAHFHRLSAFLRCHIGETKVAMAVVFVVLAAGLLVSR